MIKVWSQIGLFLQIAIVVAGVILFSLFDPFGWLNTKKQTLEHTPISVRSIKEVGKFISAEYYGEVLTSLQEATLQEITEEAKGDSVALREVEALFVEAMRDLVERKGSIKLGGLNKKKKLYKLFYKDYAVSAHPYFQTYIRLLIKKHGEKKEKKFLWKIYDTPDLLNNEINFQLSNRDFKKNLSKDIEILTGDKKFRKKQIVVLGRGWVKAGIDFGSFNDNNFRYDRRNRTIHLVGVRPQILYSTINPWFIPEKKVKGFEVIVITKRAKKPAYMHKVKRQSLEKLRQQAIQSGILDQARKNAEESLKSFFSLLIPEGIDNVIIHDDFFSYFDASFFSDSLTVDVMKSIDSLMLHRYYTDSAAVVALRDTIYNRMLYIENKPFSVGRFSSRLNMASDGILSNSERTWLDHEDRINRASLKKIKLDNTSDFKPSRLDSIWFLPDLEVISQFKKVINDTSKAEFPWYQVISDHPDYLVFKNRKEKALSIKIDSLMLEKKISALEQLEAQLLEGVSQVVNGSTTYVLKGTPSGQNIPDEGTKIQGQTFKPLADLSSQFARPQKGIHKWSTRNNPNTVNWITLDSLSKDLKNSWSIDQRSVLEVRDKIFSDCKVAFDSKGESISRFVGLYKFVEDSLLDSLEVKQLVSIHQRINAAKNYLNGFDLKEQQYAKVISQNDTLSQIMHYPSPDLIKTYKKKAEKRRYGLVGSKRKKKLKRLYVERQIQQEILKQKEKDFKIKLSKMLGIVKSVSYKQRLFLKNDNDSFDDFSEDLKFLNTKAS